MTLPLSFVRFGVISYCSSRLSFIQDLPNAGTPHTHKTIKFPSYRSTAPLKTLGSLFERHRWACLFWPPIKSAGPDQLPSLLLVPCPTWVAGGAVDTFPWRAFHCPVTVHEEPVSHRVAEPLERRRDRPIVRQQNLSGATEEETLRWARKAGLVSGVVGQLPSRPGEWLFASLFYSKEGLAWGCKRWKEWGGISGAHTTGNPQLITYDHSFCEVTMVLKKVTYNQSSH